jgi:threonine aldolase
MLDMRSDTVTIADDGMRETMRNAQVGDDCFGDDPSVLELERRCCELFGKPAAVFTGGGTMSNQLALLASTTPGDEVILDASHHINYFEAAASARFAGVAFNLIRSSDGVYDVEDVQRIISTKARWGPSYSLPRVLVVENTVGTHGGIVFPLENMERLHSYATEHGLFVYLDGARLLNAVAVTGVPPTEYARCADGLALCFAKGLGAPVGSILLGDEVFIARARKYRKWIGGDMHQAGFAAAAALYALDNCVHGLRLDHENAAALAALLRTLPGCVVSDVPTNMVFVRLQDLPFDAKTLCERLAARGLKALAWDERTVRFVTHRGLSRNDMVLAFEHVRAAWVELTHHTEVALRCGTNG